MREGTRVLLQVQQSRGMTESFRKSGHDNRKLRSMLVRKVFDRESARVCGRRAQRRRRRETEKKRAQFDGGGKRGEAGEGKARLVMAMELLGFANPKHTGLTFAFT